MSQIHSQNSREYNMRLWCDFRKSNVYDIMVINCNMKTSGHLILGFSSFNGEIFWLLCIFRLYSNDTWSTPVFIISLRSIRMYRCLLWRNSLIIKAGFCSKWEYWFKHKWSQYSAENRIYFSNMRENTGCVY